jgi:hypothetical protein
LGSLSFLQLLQSESQKDSNPDLLSNVLFCFAPK